MAVKYQANERLPTSKSEDVKKKVKTMMERREGGKGDGSQFQLCVCKWRHLSVETFGTR
jgi:hypothetical protein